jgi:hypothetical protein
MSTKIAPKKAPLPSGPNEKKSYSDLEKELEKAYADISELRSAVEKIREHLELGCPVTICDFCSLPRPEELTETAICQDCEECDGPLITRCLSKCKDIEAKCEGCGSKLVFR